MLLSCTVLLPFVMAFVLSRIGNTRKVRVLLMILTSALTFGLTLLLNLAQPLHRPFRFLPGLALSMNPRGFHQLYAAITAWMWLISNLFAPQYFAHDHDPKRYCVFNLMTLGATLGVFLSDNFLTTFIFFEVMSQTSRAWVGHEGTPEAAEAAELYHAIASLGAVAMAAGFTMLYVRIGTLDFDQMASSLAYLGASDPVALAGGALAVLGFAAKAGLFPLHIWLPKAHPVAPAPASALLSGVLTKTGVFGMLVLTTRVFAANAVYGWILLALGVVTMLLGAVMALFSVNLKRTLACSSVSQIGFITVGIAAMNLLSYEGTLAAYGVVEHIVSHSLIKLCLFLCASYVYISTHALDLNEIRGFGRGKPFFHAVFLAGLLSLACVPLGCGFVSKSLLHEGLLELIEVLRMGEQAWWIVKAAEILFIIAGGLTMAYSLKLYFCIFWDRNPAREPAPSDVSDRLSPLSAAALALTAVPLLVLGLFGREAFSRLSELSVGFLGLERLALRPAAFTLENLLGALESAAVGLAVYFLVVRRFLMDKTGGDRVYLDRLPKWIR